MSKRLILILALAFVVGITCAAYAEVQNVKVSGDINMMGIARDNFQLAQGAAGDKSDDDERNLISQIRVRIDADLTDNVMTTIRLLNERSWTTESNTNTDIDLDLAYVTLKEFLYSPLSLTLGRQELRYGNGLIIGNARNYGTIPSAAGVPTDLTERKAFDAIKAVLNYDPLVVDLVFARITNASSVDNDDTDLLGINAKYDIDKTTSAEAYFWNRQARNKTGLNNKADQVFVAGGLVSAEPIADLKASLEAAYQFGKYNFAGNAMTDRRAWAIQAKADYALPFEKTKKWSPMVGLQYTYLSGDQSADTAGDIQHDWNQMYYDQALNNITYAIIPFTNLQVLNLKGSMKPMDDVTLALNYGYYLRAHKDAGTMTAPYRDSDNASYGSYTMIDKKFLGNALDLTATYDYTEDVQFGLTAGWFKPGKAFNTDNRHDAAQLIGSMKVTF